MKVTEADIGKAVMYTPENRPGILIALKGHVARVSFKGMKGNYQATTDKQNLRPIHCTER